MQRSGLIVGVVAALLVATALATPTKPFFTAAMPMNDNIRWQTVPEAVRAAQTSKKPLLFLALKSTDATNSVKLATGLQYSVEFANLSPNFEIGLIGDDDVSGIPSHLEEVLVPEGSRYTPRVVFTTPQLERLPVQGPSAQHRYFYYDAADVVKAMVAATNTYNLVLNSPKDPDAPAGPTTGGTVSGDVAAAIHEAAEQAKQAQLQLEKDKKDAADAAAAAAAEAKAAADAAAAAEREAEAQAAAAAREKLAKQLAEEAAEEARLEKEARAKKEADEAAARKQAEEDAARAEAEAKEARQIREELERNKLREIDEAEKVKAEEAAHKKRKEAERREKETAIRKAREEEKARQKAEYDAREAAAAQEKEAEDIAALRKAKQAEAERAKEEAIARAERAKVDAELRHREAEAARYSQRAKEEYEKKKPNIDAARRNAAAAASDAAPAATAAATSAPAAATCDCSEDVAAALASNPASTGGAPDLALAAASVTCTQVRTLAIRLLHNVLVTASVERPADIATQYWPLLLGFLALFLWGIAWLNDDFNDEPQVLIQRLRRNSTGIGKAIHPEARKKLDEYLRGRTLSRTHIVAIVNSLMDSTAKDVERQILLAAARSSPSAEPLTPADATGKESPVPQPAPAPSATNGTKKHK